MVTPCPFHSECRNGCQSATRRTQLPWSPFLLSAMSGKEFLIDAVAQFLESTAWLEAVADFLETHFRAFLVPNKYYDEDTAGSKDSKDSADSANTVAAGDDEDTKRPTQSHSLAQYDAFMLFKDLVERLLEQVVADLGCSGDDLVAVLEDSARLGKHASPERQFFIKMLLSFESFSAFHKKISEFAAEKKGGLGGSLCDWDHST